ncbi:MAG: endonuclease/exonuclease/phosphatase family protein [Alphaproteobacteria bacterium]|nr:endonuclease/exonuclease/phosphatase family protein [Alphaproteobacteria bacterium]MCB9796618.1 endonuclease/exonuclease/phosphatase family protein [Alphaproteobacteria bacterium]
MSQPAAHPLLHAGAIAAGSALAVFGGFLVGSLADTHPLSLMILALEPAIWLVLVALGLHALLHRRPSLAALALLGLVSLSLSLRRTIPREIPTETPDEASPVVRECASRASTPKGELRIATWNTGGLQDPAGLALAVMDLDADIIVLQEVPGQELIDAVVSTLEVGRRGRGLEGEAASVEGLFIPAMPSAGTGLVVQGGWFGVCGSEELDRWSFELPAADGRTALATLVFPQVFDVGFMPVVAAHLDRPAGLGELPSWSERIRGSGERLGGFVRALDAPSTILLGDFNTHGTFRDFQGLLSGAGLAPAASGPTWPAALGGVPTLPLYQLDRVWAGPSWQVADVEARRTLTPSDHLAVVATLSPAAAQAGG